MTKVIFQYFNRLEHCLHFLKTPCPKKKSGQPVFDDFVSKLGDFGRFSEKMFNFFYKHFSKNQVLHACVCVVCVCSVVCACVCSVCVVCV